MKLKEILTEAIDVSGLAVAIYTQLPQLLDKRARQAAAYWLSRGEKENPSDPVQGAYDAIKHDSNNGMFHPGYSFKNRATDELRKILQNYLDKHVKDNKIRIDVTKGTKTGKGRKKSFLRTGVEGTEQSVSDFQIQFLTDTGDVLGYYRLGRAFVQVPNVQWEDLWHEFFGEYLSGNDTDHVFREFIQRYMSTTVHELTHLVNDIIATTNSNKAFLKKGQTYYQEKAKKFTDDIFRKISSNLFHLSRLVEVQAIAAEIAWESVQTIFASRFSWTTIDDVLDDLKQGYYSDTLYRHYSYIEAGREHFKDQPGKMKQLERLWKALLKAVIENIQQYREHAETYRNRI